MIIQALSCTLYITLIFQIFTYGTNVGQWGIHHSSPLGEYLFLIVPCHLWFFPFKWHPCLSGFDSWGEHVAIPWPWVDFRVGLWSLMISRVPVWISDTSSTSCREVCVSYLLLKKNLSSHQCGINKLNRISIFDKYSNLMMSIDLLWFFLSTVDDIFLKNVIQNKTTIYVGTPWINTNTSYLHFLYTSLCSNFFNFYEIVKTQPQYIIWEYIILMTQKRSSKIRQPYKMDTKDHIYLSYTYLIAPIFQLLTNVGELKLNHNPLFENTLLMEWECHLK